MSPESDLAVRHPALVAVLAADHLEPEGGQPAEDGRDVAVGAVGKQARQWRQAEAPV
jgi:hypothetical protein